MNIAILPPSFDTNMQLQNAFHQIHVLLEPLTRQRMKSWQVEADEPRLHQMTFFELNQPPIFLQWHCKKNWRLINVERISLLNTPFLSVKI